MLIRLAVLLSATVIGLAASGQAATISYGLATQISADSDVVTNGTLDRAYGFGSAGGTTVNGVTFAQFNGGAFNGDSTTIVSDAGAAYTGGGGAPFSTLSLPYQALVAAGQFHDHDPATDTFTFNTLAINQQYEVEFWVNDSRPIQRTETIDGVTVQYATAGNNGALGQFLIGTFTADATSQVINFVGGQGDTQINALELRVVPEPSSLILCGLGALGLFIAARRRK